MAKKQKIWLAVFLAMFLVPEIINPEVTVILFYWIREIFFGISFKLGESLKFDLFNLEISQIAKESLFFIKTVGLMGSLLLLLFIKTEKTILKIAMIVVLSILLLATILYSLSFASFVNLP